MLVGRSCGVVLGAEMRFCGIVMQKKTRPDILFTVFHLQIIFSSVIFEASYECNVNDVILTFQQM